MKQAVLGIIFNHNQKEVLLVKRRDVPVWVFPGGGVDAPESPEDAIIREINEETGLNVKIIRKVSEYTPVNRLTRFVNLYECEKLSGKLTTTSETYDVAFFKLDELPDSFFYIHQDFLRDALKSEKTVQRKKLHQVTYFELLKYFIKHPLRVLRFSLSLMGLPFNS